MAKKEGKQAKKKKKSQNNNMMAYLIIGVMLLSGLYALQRGDDTPPAEADPEIDSYTVAQLFNSSMISTVKRIKPELIAKIDKAVDYSTITDVKNTSAAGLAQVTFEVGNPQLVYTKTLSGTYMLFRFTFDSVDDNKTAAIKEKLDSSFGKGGYRLLAACVGSLPLNVSGPNTDEVYLPCEIGTKVGDSFRIFLLGKTKDSYFVDSIGFASKKVSVGPVVEAKVLNITSILLEGIIPSDYSTEKIAEVLTNQTEINPPQITINSSIDNETKSALEALTGVSVASSGARTTITYNSSHADIVRILSDANISYDEAAGSIAALLPLSADTRNVTNALEAAGAANLTYQKTGTVSVPSEVIINGRATTIPSSDNFNAILKTETEVGDLINLTLSAMQINTQVYVIGGTEL
jgi:hypothetical protein